MKKNKQLSFDEWAATNRLSVEQELFQFPNRSESEEYIKQFDTGRRKSASRGSGKGEDISEASNKTGKKIRKESEQFWRDYFQNKAKRFSGASAKRSIKGGKGINTNEAQDGLDKADWETWWLRSPLWRRFIGFFLAVIFIIFIAQVVTAIFLLISSITTEIEDPYVCKTPNCLYLSSWFKDSINDSVSPCEDFYQFICGNYKNENDDGVFLHGGEWDLYSAPLEFGRQNVLAEMLKNVNKNKIHDQPIKFYQTCLDPRFRTKYGLSGYRGIAAILFGDLNEIDNASSDMTLEEMAVKVTKIIGDFGFFEFEFDGFPTILITTEDLWLWVPDLNQMGVSNLKSLIVHLFPTLKNVEEISKGAQQIFELLAKFLKLGFTDTVVDVCAANLPTATGKTLDVQKIIEMYADNKDAEVEFLSSNSLKYYGALNRCFDLSKIPDSVKKASFAIFWMLRVLIFSLKELSSSEFNKLEPYLNNVPAYKIAKLISQRSLEYQCFHSLCRSLGYIPAHRYFEKLGLDGVKFGQDIEILFRKKSQVLNKLWNNKTAFPHIDTFYRTEGSKILSFEDPVYFISNIPSQNDLLLENIVDLDLTDDHFHNAIDGKIFTLLQAKSWWTRIHDKRHVLLWNSKTFNLEKAYYTIAPIDKVNSVFLPISYFLEPYDSDVLAVSNGGSAVVIMRLILFYLEEYLGKGNLQKKYGKFELKDDSSMESCSYFDYSRRTGKSKLKKTSKTELYQKDWSLFANVLAIKAAHFDSNDRDHLKSNLYSQLGTKPRRWEISKKLPGFEKYTEEHLFFMAVTRHFCRQKPSDKAHYEVYKRYVTNILATFMQMKEFSTAWKCPPNTRMNPRNKCF